METAENTLLPGQSVSHKFTDFLTVPRPCNEYSYSAEKWEEEDAEFMENVIRPIELSIPDESTFLHVDGTPPLAPVCLRQSPKRHVRSWVLRGFQNSAREDDLRLYHWTPLTDPKLFLRGKAAVTSSMKSTPPQGWGWSVEGQSAFDVYAQRKTKLLQFGADEYKRLLDVPDWTQEETVYLFNLCEQYDLRWVVIHDRYDTPNERSSRSLEDLKDRFYYCMRKLLRSKAVAGDMKATNDLLLYEYNKSSEVARKSHLERLYKRSKEVALEEEEAMLELQRRNALGEMILKEREDLIRQQHLCSLEALASNETLIPHSSGATQGSGGSNETDVKQPKSSGTKGLKSGTKKRKEKGEDGTLNKKLSNASASSLKRVALSNSALSLVEETGDAADAVASLICAGVTATVTPASHRRTSMCVSTRSSRLSVLPVRSVQKINALLLHYGLPASTVPIMPTAATCKAMETLRQEMLALLDVRKQCEKIDSETKSIYKTLNMQPPVSVLAQDDPTSVTDMILTSPVEHAPVVNNDQRHRL